MIIKQVKFRCPDADVLEGTKTELGGIAIYESDLHEKPEYIICGCCGGTFEPDEVEIIRVMEWLPISEEILGE